MDYSKKKAPLLKRRERVLELIHPYNMELEFIDAQPFTGERAPAEPTPDQGSLIDNAQKLKDKKGKVTALRRKDTHGDDD